MVVEAVGWVLLLLTLIPAIAVLLKNWTKKPATNPKRSKEKEGPTDRFTQEMSKETPGKDAIAEKADPKTLVPTWNQYVLMPSRWLDRHARVVEERRVGLQKPREIASRDERKKKTVDRTGRRYTDEDPPPLGHNYQYGGLLWRHFDRKGFHRMIQQWERADVTEYRIRTLLTWEETEMPKDLRFMAEQLLQGHRWTAHYYGREQPDQRIDDDLLPDVYQIFRRHFPQGEEGILLKKDYAKMMKERKRIGEKTEEPQWKEARKKRQNMLAFKLGSNEEKFALFRHIKPRRGWGNSLYVYFEENSVLITSDEVI